MIDEHYLLQSAVWAHTLLGCPHPQHTRRHQSLARRELLELLEGGRPAPTGVAEDSSTDRRNRDGPTTPMGRQRQRAPDCIADHRLDVPELRALRVLAFRLRVLGPSRPNRVQDPLDSTPA